jgi:hypothetical protein
VAPPREPKRSEFSASELEDIADRAKLLDKLLLEAKVDEVLATRRKILLDTIKNIAHIIAAITGIFVFGREFVAWLWKSWIAPALKAFIGGL